MKCPKCGANIDKDDELCGECGCYITDNSGEENFQDISGVPEEHSSKQQRRNEKFIILFPIVVILLLALVLIPAISGSIKGRKAQSQTVSEFVEVYMERSGVELQLKYNEKGNNSYTATYGKKDEEYYDLTTSIEVNMSDDKFDYISMSSDDAELCMDFVQYLSECLSLTDNINASLQDISEGREDIRLTGVTYLPEYDCIKLEACADQVDSIEIDFSCESGKIKRIGEYTTWSNYAEILDTDLNFWKAYFSFEVKENFLEIAGQETVYYENVSISASGGDSPMSGTIGSLYIDFAEA